MHSHKHLFFYSLLTGVFENVLRTECMRVESPGARVGRVSMGNVCVMK